MLINILPTPGNGSLLPQREGSSKASSSKEEALKSSRHTEALLSPESHLMDEGEGARLQDVNGKEQEQSRNVDDIRNAAEKANAYMAKSDTHLKFQVSENTGRVTIDVVDSETKEVIRQIPPESMSRFADRMTQLRGLLFEAKG